MESQTHFTPSSMTVQMTAHNAERGFKNFIARHIKLMWNFRNESVLNSAAPGFNIKFLKPS